MMPTTAATARTALEIVEAAVSEAATDEREAAIGTLRGVVAAHDKMADQLARIEVFRVRLAEYGNADAADVLAKILAT